MNLAFPVVLAACAFLSPVRAFVPYPSHAPSFQTL